MIHSDGLEVLNTLMCRDSDLLKDGVSASVTAEDQDLMREEAQKMSSVLPTMWMGAQNGW